MADTRCVSGRPLSSSTSRTHSQDEEERGDSDREENGDDDVSEMMDMDEGVTPSHSSQYAQGGDVSALAEKFKRHAESCTQSSFLLSPSYF
jgi:hypothetical protein